MSDLIVYLGTMNNGTHTLLTEGAAKAISAVQDMMSDSGLTYDEFWSVYTISAPSGIATFSDTRQGYDEGLTGTLADMEAICTEITRAGGWVRQFERGNFVPHSNSNPDEPPSVNLNEFRRQLGLEQVERV